VTREEGCERVGQEITILAHTILAHTILARP
jgi:hypothetical protein